MTFGEKIRAELLRCELSQKALARHRHKRPHAEPHRAQRKRAPREHAHALRLGSRRAREKLAAGYHGAAGTNNTSRREFCFAAACLLNF